MGLRMQPDSIQTFKWFFLVGAIVPLFAIMIDYSVLRQQALAAGHSPLGPIIGLLFSVAVDLILWSLIVRKASNVGKWIMVAMTALSVLTLPITLGEVTAVSVTYTTLTFLSLAAWIVACALLFRRDARQWLASGGKVLPVDPEIFR